MAGVTIVASIYGGSSVDLMGEMVDHIQMLMENHKEKFMIIKQPNCCSRCEAEDDPELFMDGGLHLDCRCRVVEIDEETQSVSSPQ